MSRRSLFLSLVLVTTACLPAGKSAHGLSTVRIATGLSSPIGLVALADDPRLFILEQAGVIRLFDTNGSDLGVFLDISDRVRFPGGQSEQGLLGLAFSPTFDSDSLFYLNYVGDDRDTRISRFRLAVGNDDAGDASSEEVLLTLDQPFSNHNGGRIAFGPDGYLYISSGDGGNANDVPFNNGQRLDTLLGKMLRIDVSGGMGSGYSVPPDNPFVGETGLDEIWAYGLRNVWGVHFDSETGDLYLADVGQLDFEEVNVQPADSPGGENYGWRLMEGDECFNPTTNCNDGSLTLPVHVYDHGGSRCSITGGAVYRGDLLETLRGKYVFADFCSDQIWAIGVKGMGYTLVELTAELQPDVGNLDTIADVALDGFGELYFIKRGTGSNGGIFRADTSSVATAPPVPELTIRATPNPFTDSAAIVVEGADEGETLTLRVVDAAGRVVREEDVTAGAAWRWDGADAKGKALGAGSYWIRTVGRSGVETFFRITLLR